MIGAVIIFIVGWTVRRLWPTGIAFLAIFPAVSVAFGILMRGTEPDLLGRTLQLDAVSLLGAYIGTLAIQSVVFFLAFGLSKIFSKKRKYLDAKEEAET
ncbi:MAG: hypothetical protein R3235_08745, partial [Altererythrobacter ishigakiensis]|nr:hypothetical protein [Altererythrobacter ishigakiensis]